MKRKPRGWKQTYRSCSSGGGAIDCFLRIPSNLICRKFAIGGHPSLLHPETRCLVGHLRHNRSQPKVFFHPSPFANISPPDLFFQHLCLFQIKMEGGSEDDCVHSKLCFYLDWKLSFTLLFSHGNAEDLGLIIRCSEAACCLNHNWRNFQNLCKTSWIGGFRILERTDKTHFVPRVYRLLPLHGTCSWWLDVA